jgi:hypothetical protein
MNDENPNIKFSRYGTNLATKMVDVQGIVDQKVDLKNLVLPMELLDL